MIGLICDTETTGLDSNDDAIIEWAWALVEFPEDKSAYSYRILQAKSFLVNTHIELPGFITDLTKITQNNLSVFGVKAYSAALEFKQDLIPACFIACHYSPFDTAFISALCEKEDVNINLPTVVDTCIDLPCERGLRGKSLAYLTSHYSIPNFTAHSALGDVLAVTQLLSHFDITKVHERACLENATLLAKVTYQDKDKAKNKGFRWNGSLKRWEKRVKSKEIDSEIEGLGFEVEIDDRKRDSNNGKRT